MKTTNLLLFLTPLFIWGSTWYVIKFQLGEIDPMVSVSYRFGAASFILFVFCFVKKRKLKFNIGAHALMALQGLLLFSTNYWLVYIAEMTLTSGLVAVIFSLLVFSNIGLSAIFLKHKVSSKLLFGAFLGVSGTILIFKPEVTVLSLSDKIVKSILLCLIGVLLASGGNVLSAYNQKLKLPVIQTNAYGMLYGSLFIGFIAVLNDKSINFDSSYEYVFSLLYLALFGSVIAFGSYLKLIGNIGPGKAGYVILLVPLIALLFSVVFESYQITFYTITGVILLMAGNWLALKRGKRRNSN